MKPCLLICNKNATTLKEVFPLIKNKILRMGYTVPKDYDQPPEYEYKSLQGLTRWMTTLSVSNKPPLILTATYNPALYPKYDNYDAINVNSIKDIPYDYEGVMGVPITILEKNLENVEIEGCFNGYKDADPDNGLITGTPTKIKGTNTLFRGPAVNEEAKYFRVLIKKNFEIEGRGGDIEWAENKCDFYTPPTQEEAAKYKNTNETWRIQNPYLLEHDKPVMPYNRVFIKLEGLLYGEYTEIDGEYIKGHRPILNNKQMYSRALIRRKTE